MKDVGKFYGHLVYLHFVYFIAVCYILCLFWYIFSSFGILYQENSGNPALKWNALMRQQSHQAHPKLLLINIRHRDQCYKIGSTFAFRKSMYIRMYVHTYVASKSFIREKTAMQLRCRSSWLTGGGQEKEKREG
jgi:hypothetical protein